MAQICADSLGVPMEGISVFHGSTDYMPRGVGTFGSRGTVMAGSAIHLACQSLKNKILDAAATYLDTEPSNLELRNGQVYRKGRGDEGPLLGLDDIVKLAEPTSHDGAEEPGLEATAFFENERLTYSYGAHVAHVAVDPETGKLDILRYVVVEDIGRCINPLLVHGQAVGGAAQGIGATILEELGLQPGWPALGGYLHGLSSPNQQRCPSHREYNPGRGSLSSQPLWA